MKIESIKKYIHTTNLTKKELIFIKEFLEEQGLSLKEILPEDSNSQIYFLTTLLDLSLKDYKNNQIFAQEILKLKDSENQNFIYNMLLSHKNGAELMINNSELQDSDKDKTFKDLLKYANSTTIIEYVKKNKKTLNLDIIYSSQRLKLNLVEMMEKEGLIFNSSILNCLHTDQNYSNPKKLLNYIKKYKEEANTKIWDNLIVNLMSFLNQQIADDYGKYKFKDAFFLITELKNPSAFKWGTHISKGNYNSFLFASSLRTLLRQTATNDRSIFPEDIDKIKEVKKFIKNNDIHFNDYHDILFQVFVDDMSDNVLETFFKDHSNHLFERIEKKNHSTKYSIIENKFLYSKNEMTIMSHKRTKKFILHAYVNNKFRFENFDEEYFFEKMGISKEIILKENFISKYKEELDLNMNVLDMLCRVFKIKDEVKIIYVKKLLEQNLSNTKPEIKKKLKI